MSTAKYAFITADVNFMYLQNYFYKNSNLYHFLTAKRVEFKGRLFLYTN